MFVASDLDQTCRLTCWRRLRDGFCGRRLVFLPNIRANELLKAPYKLLLLHLAAALTLTGKVRKEYISAGWRVRLEEGVHEVGILRAEDGSVEYVRKFWVKGW